jgi:hypothetical protein
VTERLVVIWAMPGPWPGTAGSADPDGFADVVQSATTVERWAAQGHLGIEGVRRHAAASAAIERLARRCGSPVATIAAEVLDAWPPRPGERARAGFHPPDQAPTWLRALADLMEPSSVPTVLEAADRIQAEGGGIVLTPSPVPLGPELTARPAPPAADGSTHRPDVRAADLLRTMTPEWTPFVAAERRMESARQLWAELADAVAGGEPLRIGAGARHDVLTEVLHRAATVLADGWPVRLLYVDGSEAEPFRLRRPVTEAAASGRTIRVGLMSMRHTDLDLSVDGYWFRNRMVSTSRTLAETDSFCAAVTLGRLRELSAAGIGRIELVHTGFEPAVIGFYRGLMSWLASGEPPIRVQPVYLIGDLVDGTPWGATDGAER